MDAGSPGVDRTHEDVPTAAAELTVDTSSSHLPSFKEHKKMFPVCHNDTGEDKLLPFT